MKSINGVLKEEINRLGQAEKSYEREIRALPKGSIQIKLIKGHAYPYLVFRKNSKLQYRYLGRLDHSELKKIKDHIKLRREYERNLREVRKNKHKIEKMIRG